MSSHLPARYQQTWPELFRDRVKTYLAPGITILDLGGGRNPLFNRTRLPDAVNYWGLDVSITELEAAPQGSYDRIFVANASNSVPELFGQVDLLLSFHVFEHIKPLADALENCRNYLRPGGTMIALFSGTFSAFGLVNRVVPRKLGLIAMEKLLGRPRSSVFPAYYDNCWHGAITALTSSWSSVAIESLYLGAGYFSFSRPLQSAYLRYEEKLLRGGHQNVATHYCVIAKR